MSDDERDREIIAAAADVISRFPTTHEGQLFAEKYKLVVPLLRMAKALNARPLVEVKE